GFRRVLFRSQDAPVAATRVDADEPHLVVCHRVKSVTPNGSTHDETTLLPDRALPTHERLTEHCPADNRIARIDGGLQLGDSLRPVAQIGRASCRERVQMYV